MVTNIDPNALLAEVMLTPDGRADPYPRYAAIREQVAAFRSTIGVVVVTRYEDCQWVLHDARFGKGESRAAWKRHGLTEQQWIERYPALGRRRASSLLDMNPPDHTRLRRLVSKAFTPRTVEQLRPDIVRLTDGLLDQFDGTIDVIRDLARVLPITVIGKMLGVPPSDRADLYPLVRDLVRTIEPGASLEQLDAGERASEAIAARFTELISERRLAPTDDLLSELVHVEERDDRLSQAELVSTIALLFGAGFETTTNFIGNGLLALLDHPAQLQRLREDRSLLGIAVEELLRWDTPVQAAGRTALEDVDLHGLEVRSGEQVALMLGSANRDPRTFDDPDQLDIARVGPPPMSFGSGIHRCLGAALARAEGQVVLDRLLDRFPVIEPAWGAERPRFADSIILRGLETLPIRLASS